MKNKLSLLLVLVLVLSMFASCTTKDDPETEAVNTNPVVTGTATAQIMVGDDFDAMDGIKANDKEDGDLTSSIKVDGSVDTETPGTYTLTYSVKDSEGAEGSLKVDVTVTAVPLANYPEGINLTQLTIENKDIFFAAAERYLLENVYAGVPLYNGASRTMFSDRMQLYSPEYNGVLGFGVGFSQFTADDSTVKMYEETMGNEGEYTLRGAYSTDPTIFNSWLTDDSNSSDFIELFTGALYEFYFDSSKTGYEINPSLAAGDPIPVDPEVINGKEYATTWQIPVRDDLQWAFHPDIDTSSFAEGYEKLDASDYLWTWEYALTNQWYRAKTGGGDFITQGVKNAAEFISGDITDFSEVGIRMAEGETNVIEIEFITQKSQFEVKYAYAGLSKPALCQELFEAVGGEEGYGKDPLSVATSGVYYFDSWTNGQLITYKKNDLHPDSDMYHYTGRQYRYIADQDTEFEEFLAGRLDSVSIPAARVTEFASDPRVKVAPDPTTWRLMINAFGTEDARDEFIAEYPEIGLSEDYVPEPILGYTEMRQALYYGVNRYKAAVEVVQTYLPAHTLFTPTYFLDGESGVSVRGLENGAAVVEDFGGSSNGYFPDAAVDLFKAAVEQAIADGHYEAGTADAYTEITLDLYYASSGRTSAQSMLAEIKQQYEELLVDDENFVKVIVNVNDVEFPNNYYNYMMVANMDLGIGGISGSLLDAPGFLEVFNDNNAGGFTLNWGIDTSTPNIEIEYTDLDGVAHREMWSFNAISAGFAKKQYISGGVIQEVWPDAESLIEAKFDMAGEVVTGTAEDVDGIAGFALGGTLEDLADTDEDVDSLASMIVSTESGTDYVFVYAVKDGEYTEYSKLALLTDAQVAIDKHAGDDYSPVSIELITDDETLAANEYVIEAGLATTLAGIAEATGAPAEFMEVYAVNWGDWSDIYVVLHIGDFYIGFEWL